MFSDAEDWKLLEEMVQVVNCDWAANIHAVPEEFLARSADVVLLVTEKSEVERSNSMSNCNWKILRNTAFKFSVLTHDGLVVL